MRRCSKIRCEEPPVATVGLRYSEGVVELRGLIPVHDPNLLDLCERHAARLTPPRGWRLEDRRRGPEPERGPAVSAEQLA